MYNKVKGFHASKAAFTQPSRATSASERRQIINGNHAFRFDLERWRLMRGAVDCKDKKAAFTLAEMMVVLLVMTLALAAMAPIITTKVRHNASGASSNNVWHWAINNIDGWFGSAESPRALIGLQSAPDADRAKLIINTANDYAHILFKTDNTALGNLRVTGNSIVLNDAPKLGTHDVAIGIGTLNSNDYAGGGNVVIGERAQTDLTTGANNVAIGRYIYNNNEPSVSETVAIGHNTAVNRYGAIAIGYSSTAGHSDSVEENSNVRAGSIAIGSKSTPDDTSGNGPKALHGGIAIGSEYISRNSASAPWTVSHAGAEALQSGAIAIGSGATARYNNDIALGFVAGSSPSSDGVNSGGDNIAIGTEAFNRTVIGIVTGGGTDLGTQNIAIGYQANNDDTMGAIKTIAIGSNTIASGHSSIAIGNEAQVIPDGTGSYQNVHSIAIGYNAKASGSYGGNIAIGDNAKASGNNSLAIGNNACKYSTGYGVTCIGHDSGPQESDPDLFKSRGSMIFLGTSSDTVYIPGNLVVGRDTVLGASSAKKATNKPPYSVYVKPSFHNTVADNKDVDWRYFGSGNENDFTGAYLTKYGTSGGANYGYAVVGSYKFASGETFEQSTSISSDRRLKYVGQEFKSGLDKIKQLKVFNYTFKNDPQKTPRVGVMAQDLQKIFPDAVTKGPDGFLQIRLEDMFYTLINAVKELDAKVTQVLTQIQNDRKEIQQLKKENTELKARLDKLEAKLK